MLNDDQLLRFSRHILLPHMDVAGQQRLCAATALVIGVGGLGSPVALYLAAAGFKRLILIDDDRVELTNLQRQIIHQHRAIGDHKVSSAQHTLKQLSPDVIVETVAARADATVLADWVPQADVVLDCCDNFATRFAVNAACIAAAKPLVSAAAIQWDAQLSVFDTRAAHSPCYQCLYADAANETTASCAENGVLSPLVGVMGSLQAVEAIKLIAGVGESLIGRLLMFDALHHEWRTVALPRDAECVACRGRG